MTASGWHVYGGRREAGAPDTVLLARADSGRITREHHDRLRELLAATEPAAPPKLVRDLVPQIMRDTGRFPAVHTADPEEFAVRLLDKLAEETAELRDATTDEARLTELADVLEAAYAIADTLPGGRDALHEAREAKLRDRGGFGLRLVWDGDAPSGGAR